MQLRADRQDTPVSLLPSLPGGALIVVWRHLVPFHVSARTAPLWLAAAAFSPTAMQLFAETHEMLSSGCWGLAAAGLPGVPGAATAAADPAARASVAARASRPDAVIRRTCFPLPKAGLLEKDDARNGRSVYAATIRRAPGSARMLSPRRARRCCLTAIAGQMGPSGRYWMVSR